MEGTTNAIHHIGGELVTGFLTFSHVRAGLRSPHAIQPLDPRERARGDRRARVVDPLTDHVYGDRQDTAVDPWGHRWTFSETLDDVAPDDWGGIAVTG